jgi:DNA-binding MarR family transcriptional regulator
MLTGIKTVVEGFSTRDASATINDLTEATGKSVSTVSGIIKAAIEFGYIKKTQTQTLTGRRGRPAREYTLTAKGKKLAERC